MRLQPNKNWLIAFVAISLISCSCPAPEQPIVKCHEYSKAELTQIRNAVETLPNDSILLSVLEDRQRLCINLK